MNKANKSTRDFARQLVGVVLLVHLLFAVAMAASPELHHWLHHDSNNENHECAVTHMIRGDFGDGAPPVVLIIGPALLAPQLTDIADSRAAWVSPLYLENGVLEHAPPVLG